MKEDFVHGSPGARRKAFAKPDTSFEPDLPYASFSRRVTAFVIDALAYNTGAIAFAFLASAFGGGVAGLPGAVLFGALGFLIPWAHYLKVLGATGFSRGGRLMGIQVLDATSVTPAGFWKIFHRQFFQQFISAPLLFAGFFAAFSSSRSQTWHDEVAGTVVVKAA